MTAEHHGTKEPGLDSRALPERVRITGLELAPDSVFLTGPGVILRSTEVLRSLAAGSCGFPPLWKGPLPLRDVGRGGARLSDCRVTLGPHVPLPAPAWGARPHSPQGHW